MPDAIPERSSCAMPAAYRPGCRMPAEITTARVQECVRAALADEVAAIGGVAVAHQECGISEDSVRRRLAGTHAWTDADIAALVAAAQSRLGRVLLHQRLGWLLDAGPVLPRSARRACDDITAALPPLLASAQAMAASVADRRVTRDEARALLAQIAEVRRHLDRVAEDCVETLRSGT